MPNEDEPNQEPITPLSEVDAASGEDIVDRSAELAAHDEAIANLYQAVEELGEGRLNIHSGAQAALFEGQATVLISMGLGRAYQRVMRLCEWAGTSSEGARCPVCGFHRQATTRAQSGPNRGHAEQCPLRRNLDNINRALGVMNRGRRQGPGAVISWEGRMQSSADSTPPEQYPSPLTPEGVVSALGAAGAMSSPGVITMSETNLAQLLRLWTIGQATTTRVRALAGPDAAISTATGTAPELPVVAAARALVRAVTSNAVSSALRERANAVMQALGEGGDEASEDAPSASSEPSAPPLSSAEVSDEEHRQSLIYYVRSWLDHRGRSIQYLDPEADSVESLSAVKLSTLVGTIRERSAFTLTEPFRALWGDCARAYAMPSNVNPFLVGSGTFRAMQQWIMNRAAGGGEGESAGVGSDS